jgi:hypothetical protein
MIVRLSFFIVVVVLARYVLDAEVREPFWGGASSSVWILPYLHAGGPEIFFFTGAGLVLPWVFKNYNRIKVTLICAVIFTSLQLIYFFSFTSYGVFHWHGYFFLTAPFAGTLIGLFLGAGLSEMVLRLTRKKVPA